MDTYLITIDTGTTNTRVILWDDARHIAAVEKRPIGVRNTAIDGHNGKLKEAVKSCLEALLDTQKITYAQVRRVIASGMITSNVGLVEIPHIVVPAGLSDLAAACREVLIEDVCPLPIYFIPGIKNSQGPVDLETLEAMDIMRGEEVESCAIIDRFPHDGPMLLVLPGSHTKFVSVNAGKQITGCLTTIGGELLSVITNETILADAVGREYVEIHTYNREMLLKGYDTAKQTGLARACFSARILNLFVCKDHQEAANFMTGAVFQSDIQAMLHSNAISLDDNTAIVVAGKDPFLTILVDILKHENPHWKVEGYVPEQGLPLSGLGACLIAEKANAL